MLCCIFNAVSKGVRDKRNNNWGVKIFTNKGQGDIDRTIETLQQRYQYKIAWGAGHENE